MIRRLLKDLRVLAPVGLLGALAAAVAVHWSGPAGLGILTLVAVASSVQVFGHEYTHRRMDWLLAQPLTRRGLWLQKTAALGVFLVLFLLLTLVSGIVAEGTRQHAAGWEGSVDIIPFMPVPPGSSPTPKPVASLKECRAAFDSHSGLILGDAAVLGALWAGRLLDEPVYALEMDRNRQPYVEVGGVLQALSGQLRPSVALVGFLFAAACGGLWMGLWLRQSHTAFWAALVLPVGFFLLWQFVVPPNYSLGNETYILGPSLIWGVCALLGSLIHIRRLEV